jgi:hypothetical protein
MGAKNIFIFVLPFISTGTPLSCPRGDTLRGTKLKTVCSKNIISEAPQ